MRLFNKDISQGRMPKVLAAACIASTVLALSACKHDDDEATYDITVYNLTNGQPFTPLGVVIHKPGYTPWQLGNAVSNGLEILAESGDPSSFLSEADANSAVRKSTSSTNGPFGPGSSESVTITVDHSSKLKLSLASMLANTNDAFTGVSNWHIGGLEKGESISTMTSAFDAGTESNTEAAATIPGPAGGGEGYNAAREPLDKLTVHAGVVTADDGLATSALDESHRWLGQVAKVIVTRTQ